MNIDYPSPNFDERPAGTDIDILVLHYTGLKTLQEALDRLIDPASKVSAHYVVAENGEIFCLVPEDKRAWHAGVSYWRGLTDVNAHSIGIELENPGHEFGYHIFPSLQMNALIDLSRDLLSRYEITGRNIVGHSDIAPRRKKDPGELFDWKFMANKGVGLWPAENTGKGPWHDLEIWLSALGYETNNITATLRAFQRHYLPSSISGQADTITRRTINALVALVGENGSS